MNDLIALIPLAVACFGCIYMAATGDKLPRRTRIGRFGMRSIFGKEVA